MPTISDHVTAAPSEPMSETFVKAITAERIASEWPRVRVENAVTSETPGCNGNVLTTVRACVHLGTLLPTDVKVEMGADGSPAHNGSQRRHRLWSVQSYQNGSFLFESCVPAAELRDAARLLIRVRLSGDEGNTVGEVVRSVPMAMTHPSGCDHLLPRFTRYAALAAAQRDNAEQRA